MCSYPMGQSSVGVSMQNSQPQGWSQPREEDRKVKEAWSKIARDKRKQARQRSKSSAPAGAPSISEGTVIRGQDVTRGGSNVKVAVTPNRNPYIFRAPDGKVIGSLHKMMFSYALFRILSFGPLFLYFCTVLRTEARRNSDKEVKKQ